MPEFLERKLRAEYGDNPRAIYGTLNRLGALKGNRETPKGRAMQRKHDRDVARKGRHPRGRLRALMHGY